ncbi:T255B protein, partial [Polyodon spathula]|nr:T255B protein [Polyodon spathula]
VVSQDLRPLQAGRCQYYTSGHSYLYENYFASVPCQGLTESCSLKVRSGTCYCCDLYDCANGGYLNNHYEYVGVRSCQEVLSLYVMIWLLTALNLLVFFLGILATAVLGSIKDVVRKVDSGA